MKNWKIISATLLAASLVTATSGQAWASTTKTKELETINLQNVLENEVSPTTLEDDSELVLPIIPTGYLANNIYALLTNSEKISNPNAKEALLNNIERAIARWEAKKLEDDAVIEISEEEDEGELEVEEVEVSEAEDQDEDSDKEEEEKTLAEREAKKNAQLAKVEAIKAANLAKKEAREDAKEVKKEAREDAKEVKKEAREEAKQVKKEERQSNKQDKQNGNQSGKSENKGNNK